MDLLHKRDNPEDKVINVHTSTLVAHANSIVRRPVYSLTLVLITQRVTEIRQEGIPFNPCG
mgnify:CR=1 FL=1